MFANMPARPVTSGRRRFVVDLEQAFGVCGTEEFGRFNGLSFNLP